MQEVSTCAGGGKGRRELAADQSRFADSANDQATSQCDNAFGRECEFLVNRSRDLRQGRSVVLDDGDTTGNAFLAGHRGARLFS